LFSLHLVSQKQTVHAIPGCYDRAMLEIVRTAGTGVQYRTIDPTVRYYAGDAGSVATTISRIYESHRL
jgi:hypothetical protein